MDGSVDDRPDAPDIPDVLVEEVVEDPEENVGNGGRADSVVFTLVGGG